MDAHAGLNSRQQTIPAANRKNIAEAVKRLVELYEKSERPQKAAEWRAKLKM
jgi:hypothetical protein